ncbi:MAG: tetratricopeptide repeat protein [Phycisphaerae bacterium]|nr:tetratricopeptide repeat protein [Phycisphaerae bacterium]
MSTTASISAGAVLALRDPSRSPEPVPPIVRDLLTLIAETIHVSPRPDETARGQTESHLISLIERYGTMRLAMETLASGGRRLPGISHEKAHAWSQVMASAFAQVESVLRRSPHLVLTVGKWVAAQGDTLEARLDAYQRWLDSPLPGVTETTPTVAPPTVEIELAPALNAPAPRPDLEPLLRALVEDKRAFEPGPASASRAPRLPADSRALAERFAHDSDPQSRALGLIALGRFKEAEAVLPTLRGSCDESLLWTLWGERYYFDGRFDEAVESFRTAQSAGDSSAHRRNLAAALLKSTKPSADRQLRAAIDLLTDSVHAVDAASPDRAPLETMLGSAWLRVTSADHDADLRRAIEHLELAISLLDPARDAHGWAEAHFQVGCAWLALPSGKRLENVQRAITCFERAGQVWTRETDPERRAAVQNHLGQAWERLPTGDRGMNLERAIAYFQSALETKTRDADPVGWATLQNNLGIAWSQMPGGDPGVFITRSIECHQRALDVWSDHNRRAEWAATQNNLGIAWSMLPGTGEEREKNLRRAIAAYKAALEVRTRATMPSEWASTQNNLGSTYLHLPPGSDGATVKEAVACFERALEIRTRDTMPIDWAKSQSNLGNAWLKMPGDRVSNLQRAVECFNMALVVFTKSSHPHQHEHITQKKAEALDVLDELQIMGRE